MPYRRKKLTFAISSPDEFLLSVGRDLRCSTNILNWKCLRLPATNKRKEMPSVKICVLSHRLGDLGVMHGFHLWLDGKRVVDSQLAIIELFSLDVTAARCVKIGVF